MTIQIYFLLFMIYSFLGWVMEVTCKLVSNHKFINRGFLIGPYCPIYGFGFLIMNFLLKGFLDRPLIFFFMAVLIGTLFEYISSFVMEKMFNARWWDYSNKKFNINGRVYLNNMIAFGAIAVLVFYLLNPFIINVLEKFNLLVIDILSVVLLSIIIADFIISFLIIRNFKVTVKGAKYDNTEEITKYVKDMFLKKSYLSRRLINAYPDFQTRVKIKLQEVKDKILSDE